jgi:hypothetical protein
MFNHNSTISTISTIHQFNPFHSSICAMILLKSPFRHHYELEHHGPPLWGFGQEDRKPEALGRSKAFQPLSLFNGWFKTGSSVGTLVPRPIFYIIVNRSNNKSGWDVNTQLINPSYTYPIQNLAMHESICLKIALVWIPRLRKGCESWPKNTSAPQQVPKGMSCLHCNKNI